MTVTVELTAAEILWARDYWCAGDGPTGRKLAAKIIAALPPDPPKVGDTVQHTTGGEPLVVLAIHGPYAWCRYVSDRPEITPISVRLENLTTVRA